MVTGTVKFFNTSKGYGFIQPEEGGTDVFVHMTALDKAGIGTLKEGQRVQFDVVKGQNGKEAADNLSIAWFIGVTPVGGWEWLGLPRTPKSHRILSANV